MPRILLVEDDPDVRLVVEHILVDAGYQVDATGTMAGGTTLLDSREYDLVIADGLLPDGTGMDICDLAAEREIDCFIITGYAFTLPVESRDRYEVLLKPLRPHELVAAVEKALG